MKLYHAAPATNLDSIFERGLLPREMTTESTYQGVYQSRTGLVYLSRIGLLIHALIHRRQGREPALVEVDVRRENLLPDEDCLAVNRAALTGETFEQALLHSDPRENPQLAMPCLEQFGSAAHDGPIPPKRIRRAAIVTDPGFWSMVEVLAPMPGPVIAPLLQDMIRLAMGDTASVPDIQVETADATGAMKLPRGTRYIKTPSRVPRQRNRGRGQGSDRRNRRAESRARVT